MHSCFKGIFETSVLPAVFLDLWNGSKVSPLWWLDSGEAAFLGTSPMPNFPSPSPNSLFSAISFSPREE